MTIPLSCPGCKAPIAAPEEMAGLAAACPACGSRMTIPQATADESPPALPVLLPEAKATFDVIKKGVRPNGRRQRRIASAGPGCGSVAANTIGSLMLLAGLLGTTSPTAPIFGLGLAIFGAVILVLANRT